MPGPRDRALLLAGLALAAAFAGPGPWPQGAAQQAQQAADLALVEVLPGQPRVGLAQNVSALVRNLGPEAALTFEVAFFWGDNATPLLAPEPPSQGSVVAFPAQASSFTSADGTGPPPSDCLGAQQGLLPGCTVRANFAWNPPEARAGQGTILARATLGVGQQDPGTRNNEAANATFVALHRLVLELEPADNRTKQAEAGEAAAYRVAVRNEGNAADEVRLGVASAQWPDARAAANGTLDPAPEVTLRVMPNATARALALLRAPAAGPATALANVTANTTASAALPGRLLALPATQAAPTPGHAFDLEAPPPASVHAGVEAVLEVRARNLGGAEDALRWSVAGVTPGWNASLVDEWTLLEGPEGGRATARLRVRADPGLGPAAQANLTLAAASHHGAPARSVPLVARVPAPDLVLRDLRAEAPGGPRDLAGMAVYQGDEVLLRVDVANEGPAAPAVPARLVVEVQAPGLAAARVAEQFLPGLSPGQARTVLVPWATGALQGEVQVRARLDPDANLAEHDEANNDLARQAVVRLHGLAAEAPTAREAAPGERLLYQAPGGFAVRNLGNAAERVLLVFRTPSGWAQHEEARDVAAGGRVDVPFALAVPDLPGTAEEPLVLEARLANRSATRAEASSPVRIRDEAPPVLVALEAPDFVELGQPAAFRATLRDPVGVRDAQLRLRLPDGAVQVEPLARGAGLDWTARAVLAQPGPVAFWVTAEDTLGHALDTGASPGALLVGVRSAPSLELAEPLDGAAVRPGTPLRFRVSDVHGIASVVVQDGSRRLGLEAPWELRTDDWTEGLHDLVVTATNRYGNAATLRASVTIDATPPRLQDARATPGSAAPGEEVRVDARTSEDASVGAVRVLREGTFVREEPARVGLRSFTANLSLDTPGRYVLRLVVEDAAGNDATADVPVVVGEGAPGPGAALLALAALAAALAGGMARRRRG